MSVFYVMTPYSRVASQAVLTPIYQTTRWHGPQYKTAGQPAFDSRWDKPFSLPQAFHIDSGIIQPPGKHKPHHTHHETPNGSSKHFISGGINILCDHVPNVVSIGNECGTLDEGSLDVLCAFRACFDKYTVIPRLTKIICSGITFVSRNLPQPKRDFPQVSIENRLIRSGCCPLFKDNFYKIVKSTL